MRPTVIFKFHVPGVGNAIYSAVAESLMFDAITHSCEECPLRPTPDRPCIPIALQEDYNLGRPIRSLEPKAFVPGGLVGLLEMCESPWISPDPNSSFQLWQYGHNVLGRFLSIFVGVCFVNLTEPRQTSSMDRIGAGMVRLLDNIVRPKPICPMVRVI